LKDKAIQSGASGRQGAVSIAGEALAVLAAGLVFAAGANLFSPRGLVLTRNYFPAGTGPLSPMRSGAGEPHPATNSVNLTPAQHLAARIQEQGFQLISGRQVAQLFDDPRFRQGIVVFIDARDESHYREGHIPGAYEFDPYYPERYFTNVFPACQAAEQVVVYCNGGDCDDSESAAITLREVGIASRKFYIYGDGIPDWITNGLPVETGARNSGTLRHPAR
jgi:rhodanese-related sulfurtransferase